MNNSDVFPYIEFILTIGTWDYVGEAYADTGFEGGLIPAGLGREVLGRSYWSEFAIPGGYVVSAMTWDGFIEIADRRHRVEVAAYGSRFLLGREILDQMEVCFVFGRELRIRFAE